MARVLLVDDDDIFRRALNKALESLGHDIVSAPNGRQAQEVLSEEKFDVIVSDIRMPEIDGIELTKYVKANFKTPVVLITGFAEILETYSAHEIGADAFIAKPFEREDIERAIQTCLCRENSEAADQKEEYCKVGIEDFLSGREIQYNIFIKLSEIKFIKIAHKGEDVSLDRIRSFKSRGVDFLYLRKTDFREYVGFSLKVAKASKTRGAIAESRRINLLRHTGEILLEQINHDGVDQETFEGAAAFVETTVEILTEDTNVMELLSLLNSHSDHLYGHCVGVSLYGVMIARSLDWRMPSNSFKIATGGLLHDIGKKEIDSSIFKKPRLEWTTTEVQLYESHCTRGVKLLSQIPSIPVDVLRIVKEHHEDCHALGFPSGLKRTAIHPMAKVVAVANEFCDRVLRSATHPGMKPQEAIRQMQLLESERLESQFFDALKRLFQSVSA